MLILPYLKRGDKGQAVLSLQSELNKVGAMLVPDGDFGPATERGVRYAQDAAGQPANGAADPNLWKWLDRQPQPYGKLHTNGIAFIAKEETGGLHYYQMVTRWPHYPGHASGITIGVGYDLRFQSEGSFKSAWGPFLPAATLRELSRDIGQKGSRTRAQALQRSGIDVPFKAAWPVFVTATLPRFYQRTAGIYPSLDRLPDLCRSALVSLVFNRGAGLSGSRRRELREIRAILAAAEKDGLDKPRKKAILQGVEDRLLSMKRLWAPGSGLIQRRQAEANLWREGLRAW